jgi:hypothetical protein
MISSRFKVPIYDIEVRIIILEDGEDFQTVFPGLPIGGVTDEGVAHCMVDDTGRANIIIEREYVDYDTITHEVYHLTCAILNNAGLVQSSDSEEAYAYLNGYLNSKVFKFIVKKLKI